MQYDIKLEAIYDCIEDGESCVTVDVAEQAVNEGEHMVIYFLLGDHKKLKAMKVEQFNDKFRYEGMLNELTSAKGTKQFKKELKKILDEYLPEEFAKKESERNNDMLNFGYEISMLNAEWIESE